jgi:hypothetical protein
VNRKDKRRVKRLKKEELHAGKGGQKTEPPPAPDPSHTPAPAGDAQVQAVAQAVAPLPPNLKPWQPGQSGNPDGYSRGRRFSDGFLKRITEENADRAISTVWLSKVLSGDPKFWKMMLDHCQDQASKDRDPIDAATILPEETNLTIDPAVAERLMAAAEPGVMPLLEDDDARVD